jgi:hypothetical protein
MRFMRGLLIDIKRGILMDDERGLLERQGEGLRKRVEGLPEEEEEEGLQGNERPLLQRVV